MISTRTTEKTSPGTKHSKVSVLGVQFRAGTAWFCVGQCDCGTVRIFAVCALETGHTKSCGCHRVSIGKKLGYNNIRHGESGTPLHNLWHLVKIRCNDPNQESYPFYGGRGITICDEWANSYEAFRDYALSHGYKPGLQIDRCNNDGNYEPGNVRFVTCKINNRNRRNTPFVTAWGETKCLAEWAEDERCKIRYIELWRRLSKHSKHSWTPEKAISTPPLARGKSRSIVAAHE